MPIPKPNDGESEDDFMSRCMSDDTMQEYDSEERLGVCRGAWDDSQKADEGKGVRPVFERKSYPDVEVKLTNADEGIWEAYASTFKATPDPYGDVVDKGAFKRTIRENFKRIRNLWNHNVNEPIGRPLALSEDSHGLLTRNQLVLGVQRAREVRELMAAGVVNEVSIGFDTVTDRVKDNIRHLVEVRLWDISPVTYAANEEAQVLSVKGYDLMELLRLRPDISEAKLRQAIDALQALLPDCGKAAGSTTAPDDQAEAAEMGVALAELEAVLEGFDAREAERCIDQILANL
ncbi:MAG: Caudovirus prohead protease [Actinobacteria bacterium ADurb.Bin444]|nr:MAG: Caudovirus prohead protease [Actinobacteria bacterium ADurb.Bin444]